MTGHKRYKVMSNNSDPTTNPSQTMVYQIRIKGHNQKIFDKLQVHSRTEAVARARELGLL